MCQENQEEPRKARDQFLKGGLWGCVIRTPSLVLYHQDPQAGLVQSRVGFPMALCTVLILCSESKAWLIKKNHGIPGPVEDHGCEGERRQ